MPTWGQQPFRDVLPKLQLGMAKDAARAGGQASKTMQVGVAFMDDDTVIISLSVAKPTGWIAEVARHALSARLYRASDWSVIASTASPDLDAHPVPDWFRG